MLQQENSVIKSVSVANLVQQRNAILERVQLISKVACEMEQIGRSAQIRIDRVQYGAYRHEPNFSDETDKIRSMVDAQFWNRLMNESGLRTFMDAKRRKEWDETIHEAKANKVPEFTEESVKATFAALHGQRDEMVVDGVVEVFRQLSWDYKTNNPVKFGKRIITRIGGFYSHGCNALSDLDRVMHIFDGKPEPDHRDALGSKVSRSNVFGCKRQTLESDYLRVECYKNGNGHITFKRLDFVDRMNRMVAERYPGCLPEAR